MPKQQNPLSASVEGVLAAKGFLNRDKFVVGVGGQTVFNVSKEITSGFTVFEDGVITIKIATQTDTNQITTSLINEGVVVEILY